MSINKDMYFILRVILLSLCGISLVMANEKPANEKAPITTPPTSPSSLYTTTDRNRDGKPDAEAKVGRDGRIYYQAIDSNFDDIMDTFYFYNKDAVLERQEIDSNFDGKVDIIVHFRDGVYITKLQKDNDFDGKMDETKNY